MAFGGTRTSKQATVDFVTTDSDGNRNVDNNDYANSLGRYGAKQPPPKNKNAAKPGKPAAPAPTEAVQQQQQTPSLGSVGK